MGRPPSKRSRSEWAVRLLAGNPAPALNTADMAKKRARRRKLDRRRNHQKRSTSRSGEATAFTSVMGPPAIEMSELLTLMVEVAASADKAVAMTSVADRQLGTFDVAVLVRGINALKSARLLLSEYFWEAVDGQVRQLFELVINMSTSRPCLIVEPPRCSSRVSGCFKSCAPNAEP